MKSPTDFIVKPYNGRRYDNVKKIGGIDFITSVSKEDHKSSTRFAEVIETPLGYKGEIVPGDLLVVHHNVFKFYYDMRGRQRSGKSFLRDDLFLVDDYQFYLYKHDGKWKAKDLFCFVEPVEKDSEYYLYTFGSKQPLVGIIKYSNDRLRKFGVNEGDLVTFIPDSEYEYTIDGCLLYRVLSNSITTKI